MQKTNPGRFFEDYFARSSTDAGVDDKRCVLSDDDSDVRHEPHAIIENHVHMIGNLQRIVLLDQWRNHCRI